MKTEPDLCFCGFSLWIDSRQFLNASDYWDGNWLMVRAEMNADKARVRCDGPILMTSDVFGFRDQLVSMADTLTGQAALNGLEPELNIVLKMQKLGRIEGVIEITPDHLNQDHRFIVEADQSYLPALILSCDAILERFPVINREARG